MSTHDRRPGRRGSTQRDAAVVEMTPSLLEVIDRAHARVWQGLGLPPHATLGHLTPLMDGYDTEDAYDAEVATLSAHLATVEAVVHPAARRRMADGRTVVAAQRRHARHLEQLMRLIEGRFYGDTHSRGMDVDRLQDILMRDVAAYIHAERDLVGRLDATLTSRQRKSLVEHYSAALSNAPTRPHPYVPHPRGLAGTTFRMCAVWDRALDLMDNRIVPGPPARRRTTPLSRWGSYLLGSPQFEETPRSAPADAAAARQPVEAEDSATITRTPRADLEGSRGDL
jgi:hypothetical protein